MGDSEKKEKGWEHLNSDESIIGSYQDNDGSWGYKNEDDSASFYDADGSWGYRNKDGSCSYYGAGGAWGYKNSDGSGSYYDSDNSSTYYDAKAAESDHNESGWGDLLSGLAGIALGLGLEAYSKHNQEKREEGRIAEEKRIKAEHIRKEKRANKQKAQKNRNKRMKSLFFNKKKITIGASTTDLVSNDIKNVTKWLEEMGFNNLKSIPVKDIYTNSNKVVGEVEQIVINGESWFEENDEFPYDAEIIITYHVKREIAFPLLSRQVHKKNYDDLLPTIVCYGFYRDIHQRSWRFSYWLDSKEWQHTTSAG